jgi:hypothetical protein
MKPGDVVEFEIDGIGVLRNPIIAESGSRPEPTKAVLLHCRTGILRVIRQWRKMDSNHRFLSEFRCNICSPWPMAALGGWLGLSPTCRARRLLEQHIVVARRASPFHGAGACTTAGAWDPNGIRLEVNFVPGAGLLTDGVQFNPVTGYV